MRLALVTQVFAPSSVTACPGINRYALGLAAALVEQGVGVRIVTPWTRGLEPFERWRGIEIYRLRDSKSILGRTGVAGEGNVLTFDINLERQKKILSEVDVIQSDIPLNFTPRGWPSVALVGFVHHLYRVWRPVDLLTVPFGDLYLGHMLKIADEIVVPSMATARDVAARYGIQDGTITIIPHGIDKSLFRPTSPCRAGDEARPRLAFVGLLETRKGIFDLPTILDGVRKHHPGASLTIIGTGPDERKLRGEFDDHGSAGHVSFLGNVGDRELVSVLTAADVLLFPSRLEGFGFVAAEAMACGKVVVAYDSLVTREVIGSAGVLVPDGDLAGFADAISRLLYDKEERATIGTSARARALEKFDWAVAAEKYVDVYQEAIQSG